MSNLLFDPLMGGLQRVLDLRSQQHALTASNLANADTPGFLAKYIPFDEVLSSAVGSGAELALEQTHDLHMTAPGADPSAPEIEEIEAPPWASDGNSVIAERETTKMAENSLLYGGVAQGMGRRLAMLRYAASDGRSG